jgi:OOP family OmpA-OmpF porin
MNRLIQTARRAALLSLAAAALALPALAQTRAPAAGPAAYVGASVGQSKGPDWRCSGNCDTTDTAWRILVGYQFDRNFSLEAGYHDLGKVTGAVGGTAVGIDNRAFELVGIGAWPLADAFAPYAKLGLFYGQTKATAVSGSLTGSTDEGKTGLTFGLGLQVDLNRNLGLRAEWQRYNNMGGGEIGNSDVDVLSAGILWKFR